MTMTGAMLLDLLGDLEWLAGEFPELADDANALHQRIRLLRGWDVDFRA